MSLWRLVQQSLRHHWRVSFSVALGVAAATAVLVGALLVGDSVRESLRRLTLERLGKIDEILVSDRFFRQELVQELSSQEEFQRTFSQAAPAILFPQGTIEVTGGGGRATGILIVGCEASFWDFGEGLRPQRLPGLDEIVLNQALADDLHAATESDVVLRLPKGNQVPADSPLAQKSDRIRSLPGLKVVDVIPARGLGRFSLRASQSIPLVAFVSLETLQSALEQEGRINSILVSLQQHVSPDDREASATLARAFRPALEDFGLSLKRVTRRFPEDAAGKTLYDYFSVTSDRMILSPEMEAAVRQAFAPFGGQGVMTYLANTIAKEGAVPDGPISYSMVTGIDAGEGFRLLDLEGQAISPLADDEIILNRWSAEDQQAQPGDRIRLDYFLPETAHGQTTETSAEFVVKAITPLTEPASPYHRNREARYDQPPALANDPDFTPEVAGVTDQETIEDWDAPFPFDYQRVRGQDDDYWENHRTTPKAFVSLATAERLWGSRFGRITSFRIPVREGLTEDALKQAFEDHLRQSGETLGLAFTPVKRQQLAASKGTTPFDGLFLGLSFFIIAAALLLVALLFRLGVEQRAEELGTALAVGLRRGLASRWLMMEGALVAAAGGLLGVLVGMAYAWLMLAGLRTWWVGAITTPFLEFHGTPRSLLLGYLLGVLVSVLTIAWSVRQTRRIPVRRLLAGRADEADSLTYTPPRAAKYTALAATATALGLAVIAVRLAGMAQAGAFLGAGAAFLTGLLLWVWIGLRGGGRTDAAPFSGRWALAQLALRNAGRNPGRSVATIGLMATASFLIVALSSFRLGPSDAGAGGFDLLAQSAEPIFVDLNSAVGREEILANQQQVLSGGLVFGFRLQPGDDASCNNLYRSSQPQLLGVTPQFIEHFSSEQVPAFRWMQSAATTPEEKRNPWRLLDPPEAAGEGVPAVLDMNTAMYSLKPPVSVGDDLVLTYVQRSPIRLRVVGLLENSVLQGSLLISEKNFERLFPDVSGYRHFLIRSAPGRQQELAELLEDRLGDQGMDVVQTSRVLEQLFAVQNTYLSTFQSLGALGLLLGTFGLAAVQLRNVLERRGELALLRATGFGRQRLVRLVLIENVLLLLGGLLTGTLAALLAVLPHKFSGDAAIPLGLLRDLGVMLLVVFLVGFVFSFAAARASLKVPLLAALRGQ